MGELIIKTPVCKMCGRTLGIRNVLPSIKKKSPGLCKPCSMLGNTNKKGKFKNGEKESTTRRKKT